MFHNIESNYKWIKSIMRHLLMNEKNVLVDTHLLYTRNKTQQDVLLKESFKHHIVKVSTCITC